MNATPAGPQPAAGAALPESGTTATPLTLLLTVFNGLPYIRETVESVFAQKTGEALPRFVFLVLDNGSEDGTGEWLETLTAPAHIELRLERLPRNIGRTAVLNRGLALADTPLTAIIDADDTAHPERLLRQAAFLAAHPNIDLLGSDIININPAGGEIGRLRFPRGHGALRDHFPLFNPFAHAAVCYRTEAARKAGGYPEHAPYAQDLALWIAMLRNGSRLASIGEPLANIRVHPGQATRSLIFQRARLEDAARTAADMLEIPGLSPAARQAARLRLAGSLWRLGRRRAALEAAFAGIKEAPFLLPVNPILWRRVLMLPKKIR